MTLNWDLGRGRARRGSSRRRGQPAPRPCGRNASAAQGGRRVRSGASEGPSGAGPPERWFGAAVRGGRGSHAPSRAGEPACARGGVCSQGSCPRNVRAEPEPCGVLAAVQSWQSLRPPRPRPRCQASPSRSGISGAVSGAFTYKTLSPVRPVRSGGDSVTSQEMVRQRPADPLAGCTGGSRGRRGVWPWVGLTPTPAIQGARDPCAPASGRTRTPPEVAPGLCPP